MDYIIVTVIKKMTLQKTIKNTHGVQNKYLFVYIIYTYTITIS